MQRDFDEFNRRFDEIDRRFEQMDRRFDRMYDSFRPTTMLMWMLVGAVAASVGVIGAVAVNGGV